MRIDLKKRTANILISDGELAERRANLQAHPFAFPKSQTPWQQIQREMVAQFDEGMVLKPAVDTSARADGGRAAGQSLTEF